MKKIIKNITLVRFVSGIAIIVSFILLISIKMSFDKFPKIQEIIFGIGIGIFTSSLVSFFVDWSNTRTLKEKNQYVKEIVLKQYTIQFAHTFGEFKMDNDRGLDCIPYHFDHFLWSIKNRILPISKICNEILEKYNSILEKSEVDALNNLSIIASSFSVYKKDFWKDEAEAYNTIIEAIYNKKTYNLDPPREYPQNMIEKAQEIINEHKKSLSKLEKSCTQLQKIMPKIFRSPK